VRRYIQQASGFFLKADAGLADESARLATDASAGVAASAQMYAEVEARLLNSGKMEGIALRYGFFYGTNTWYCPEGAAADHVRRREMPVIGQGEGVWSFVHIEDAALASVAALTAPPVFIMLWMTILLQSTAGCQRLRDGLELHPLPS